MTSHFSNPPPHVTHRHKFPTPDPHLRDVIYGRPQGECWDKGIGTRDSLTTSFNPMVNLPLGERQFFFPQAADKKITYSCTCMIDSVSPICEFQATRLLSLLRVYACSAFPFQSVVSQRKSLHYALLGT